MSFGGLLLLFKPIKEELLDPQISNIGRAPGPPDIKYRESSWTPRYQIQGEPLDSQISNIGRAPGLPDIKYRESSWTHKYQILYYLIICIIHIYIHVILCITTYTLYTHPLYTYIYYIMLTWLWRIANIYTAHM